MDNNRHIRLRLKGNVDVERQAWTATDSQNPPQGALATVTNAGWDAVDAAASARKVISGRIFDP